MRQEVLDRYGRECACCGESIEMFLCVDHVNGGGNQHRKEIGVGSVRLYSWLKQNGWPDEFQILCCNCNAGKYKNGGVCPHEAIS
jgi:hypothetical protein